MTAINAAECAGILAVNAASFTECFGVIDSEGAGVTSATVDADNTGSHKQS